MHYLEIAMKTKHPKLAKAIGKRLVEVRTKAGLSQSQLTKRCKIETTAVSRLENGHNVPELSTLIRLAKGLGVPVDALLP